MILLDEIAHKSSNTSYANKVKYCYLQNELLFKTSAHQFFVMTF